jgi:SAM-dependent methyltransferase
MLNMNNVIRWIRRKALHFFHELNPASRRKAAQWENSGGVNFLRIIGVKKNDVVIDFGCGPGKFCIPAARLVEAAGMVYAVDKNPSVLKKVRRKADMLGLKNLHAAGCLAELLPLPDDRKCNVALLYDMLHFLDAPERRELYAMLHAILAENGILSVHLKHVKGDDPARYFLTMSAEDVAREIETNGFCLSQRLPVRVWHSHNTENGVAWNFIKRS